LPVTLPLKFPLSTNDPLSVSPETKHDEFVEKLKLLTVSVPLLLLATSDVPKVNTVVLPVSVSAAFQLPLILEGFELLEPHPISAKHTASNTAMPSFFVGDFFMEGFLSFGILEVRLLSTNPQAQE
jgi:hypothetical protein